MCRCIAKPYLDDWAAEPKMTRKLIFVADDYVHPLPHAIGLGANAEFPDGFRPETDAEFRERIKSVCK